MKITRERTVYGLMMMLFGFLVMSVLVSCNDSDSPGTARLEVRLTDAPGDYEEVNVDIQELRVHSDDDDESDDDSNNDDDDSGWISIPIKKGVYNLLEFRNGIDTLLGTIDLPAGKISQIRLVLGSNNTLKIDGQTYPLTTPSAQQSGLKVQVHEELKEGITYKILLDFDAALSIVKRGNGDYNLKPVIRAVTQAVDGAIAGTVQPFDAKPTVYAIVGTDTVSTFADITTGAFFIGGLEPGSYRVVFEPTFGYLPKTVDGVVVETGRVTTMGTIQLENGL